MNGTRNPSERGLWLRMADRVLDLLYPPSCAVCEELLRGGRSLCGGCDVELPRLPEPFCRTCGEHFEGEIEGEFRCPNCHGVKFSFEFARPALLRDERTLGMIHGLKYGRRIHLADELGRLAVEALEDPRFASALEGAWPLVPVPLHRKRRQWRYFNQAHEIARRVSADAGLPVFQALRRVQETETQTALSRKQRMENLRGAFAPSRVGLAWAKEKPPGAILVDDVFTTGSTVEACAKVLRKAGVRRVFVLTVMRG